MVCEVILDVKRKDVYEVIMDSVYNELKTMNPNIKKSDIKGGYTYHKNLNGMMKQKADVEVKIHHVDPNKRYHVSFKSQRGETSVDYRLSDTEEGTTLVAYEETFKGNGTMNQMNYNLMNRFYAKKSRKKVIALLRNIENYILSKEKPCQD